MRITRRAAAAVSLTAGAALVLSACSGDSGDGDGDATAPADDAGLSQESAVYIGWNQPFFSYNANSATGNATANAIVKYLISSSFNYYDQDLALTPDESFGSYEVTSEDPLTVEYTLADGVQWSDEVPVTPTDMLLEWAAQSGQYNNVEPEYDDEGNVTNQEAVDAGVYFDAVSSCVPLIEEKPETGDSTFTITYSVPFADWETCLTGPNLPAHVVGQRALGIEDAAEATQAVQDAIVNDDLEALGKIAKVWSTDFNYTSLPDDPGLYLSTGAYVMTDFVENQYMTLEANENYTGDLAAGIQTVTIRYNEDPLAQVQALQNGELDLISPQSTADVLASLEAIEGLEVQTGDEGTYEHVDLQFANGGPFDPATYGGDAEKAKLVRQAFLKTIPRQQIVDTLIAPLNPEAELRSSYTTVPGSPNYDPIVEGNGMTEQYGEVDIAGAQALLAQAGVTTPIQVRLLFAPDNVRRQNQYQLIADSATQAGFEVVPYQVQTDWGTDLSNATNFYDAALFGWQSTSTAVTESQANYETGGGNNYYGYSNPQVDALYDELAVTTDEDRQGEILTEIEALLVEDAFGVTIFQFPGVTAWDPTAISGVSKISISPTIFAGFWNWTPGEGA
ncbi:ABC transporter family substrate-binding protein [Cellulomonas marina]|uniref:Peptide/nickel transport system substrate-binding protein n=1 Tax=Cellulomonas marina TaxID=988821 RepID=A0A1I0ZHM2_9CELL|nr:ABC transporter family substrate-binding protein [Cellulomonas marina]GIG28593.1 peptide ABC transporter substrate-binding protein [Cellulomonas marina]SFB25164.1 peptide/nickel transport system substrate-binding protein [Cellulomonas marina]